MKLSLMLFPGLCAAEFLCCFNAFASRGDPLGFGVIETSSRAHFGSTLFRRERLFNKLDNPLARVETVPRFCRSTTEQAPLQRSMVLAGIFYEFHGNSH